MSLIKPLSQLEQDLAAMREDVLAVAEATHHLAATLKNRNERFWSQPVDRIVATLNDDVNLSVSVLTTSEAIADAINDSLNAVGLDQFSNRAPSTTPDFVKFDGTKFVAVQPQNEINESI